MATTTAIPPLTYQGVASIRGNFRPDVVTQNQLARAYRLRVRAERAKQKAWDAARDIANRLREGAGIEDGKYRFNSWAGPVDPGDTMYDAPESLMRPDPDEVYW